MDTSPEDVRGSLSPATCYIVDVVGFRALGEVSG